MIYELLDVYFDLSRLRDVIDLEPARDSMGRYGFRLVLDGLDAPYAVEINTYKPGEEPRARMAKAHLMRSWAVAKQADFAAPRASRLPCFWRGQTFSAEDMILLEKPMRNDVVSYTHGTNKKRLVATTFAYSVFVAGMNEQTARLDERSSQTDALVYNFQKENGDLLKAWFDHEGYAMRGAA